MSVQRNILSYFPKKHNPREVQAEALRAVERHWNSTDVFCINLPVAAGKSDFGYTIAKYAKSALILTPSKILVDQYLNDFPGLPHLKSMEDYVCPECVALGGQYTTCHEQARIRGTARRPSYSPSCEYPKHLRRARVVPYLLCNYHVAMAHSLRRDVLVVDEAHQLIPFIQGLNEKTLWQHKWNYPNNIRTQGDLLEFINRLPRDAETEEIKAALEDSAQKYSLERTHEEYGRADKDTGLRRVADCIHLKPIDIRDTPPLLWHKGTTKKIILMSATIGPMDVEALGLGRDRGYRVTHIESSSPIEASRRPTFIAPIANLSYKYQDESVPTVAKFINDLHDRKGSENGVVHLTYGLAAKLKRVLDNPDFMWHSRDDRSAVYETFRSLPPNSGKVLFACGLYEGIDLKEDVARWQVLVKIPWPSLADSAVKHQAEVNEDWYTWNTLKIVLQFSGRVCRTPADYGESFIIDTSFSRLWKRGEALAPNWFKETLRSM